MPTIFFRLILSSSHPVHQASCALTRPGSNPTAMLLILTAATAPMPTPTKATQLNTAPSRSPSSRARSTPRSAVLAPALAPLWSVAPLPPLLLPAVAALAARRLFTANVAVLAGLAALRAPPAPANTATLVCFLFFSFFVLLFSLPLELFSPFF